MHFFVAQLIVVSLLQTCNSISNGVGRTPSMGWNSWNRFRCDIDENLIREVADVMVSSGLRDAGYKYVNLDDCWQERRDEAGNIVPNYQKFPSGIKALADYVHSKGLLFGLYSDTGNKTCEGYPGSWGHEQQDANTYASWGVDYLKYDFCYMEHANEPVEESYARMSRALNATGRPILFSLCSWGTGKPWLWGNKVGNSWRTDADLFAVWDEQTAARLKLPSLLKPVMRALQVVEELSEHASPGGFNDPDMLVVGLDGMSPFGVVQECPEHIAGCVPGTFISRERWGVVGGLTYTEQKTHFALWCMLSAPLMLGNDPRTMTKATLSILKAPEILALSQDPLGRQAKKVHKEGQASVWVKPLADGRMAALLFNEGSEPIDINLVFSRDMPDQARAWARDVPGPDCADKSDQCAEWARQGACENNSPLMWAQCRTSCPAACPKELLPPGPKATAVIRDAWQEDDLGIATGLFITHLVEPHEARVLTLTFMEPADAQQWAEDWRKHRYSSAATGTSSMASASNVAQPITGAFQGGLQAAMQHQGEVEGGGPAAQRVYASRRELHDRAQGADELKIKVSQLSADLTMANEQLGQLSSKIKQTEALAEQMAQQLQQQQQAARAQQHLLDDTDERVPVKEHQDWRKPQGASWDEARVGAAVWGRWPGRMLLACNGIMLLVLLTSQFKRPRGNTKPGSHSR